MFCLFRALGGAEIQKMDLLLAVFGDAIICGKMVIINSQALNRLGIPTIAKHHK